MEQDRHIWRYWARNLQQWGVSESAAVLLEMAGPLTILGAQLIYIGQPLFKHSVLMERLDVLAGLLEDSTKRRAFITFLREATDL